MMFILDKEIKNRFTKVKIKNNKTKAIKPLNSGIFIIFKVIELLDKVFELILEILYDIDFLTYTYLYYYVLLVLFQISRVAAITITIPTTISSYVPFTLIKIIPL